MSDVPLKLVTGHADVWYRGGGHECLALSSRLSHSVNRTIDGQSE